MATLPRDCSVDRPSRGACTVGNTECTDALYHWRCVSLSRHTDKRILVFRDVRAPDVKEAERYVSTLISDVRSLTIKPDGLELVLHRRKGEAPSPTSHDDATPTKGAPKGGSGKGAGKGAGRTSKKSASAALSESEKGGSKGAKAQAQREREIDTPSTTRTVRPLCGWQACAVQCQG